MKILESGDLLNADAIYAMYSSDAECVIFYIFRVNSNIAYANHMDIDTKPLYHIMKDWGSRIYIKYPDDFDSYSMCRLYGWAGLMTIWELTENESSDLMMTAI